MTLAINPSPPPVYSEMERQMLCKKRQQNIVGKLQRLFIFSCNVNRIAGPFLMLQQLQCKPNTVFDRVLKHLFLHLLQQDLAPSINTCGLNSNSYSRTSFPNLRNDDKWKVSLWSRSFLIPSACFLMLQARGMQMWASKQAGIVVANGQRSNLNSCQKWLINCWYVC